MWKSVLSLGTGRTHPIEESGTRRSSEEEVVSRQCWSLRLSSVQDVALTNKKCHGTVDPWVVALSELLRPNCVKTRLVLFLDLCNNILSDVKLFCSAELVVNGWWHMLILHTVAHVKKYIFCSNQTFGSKIFWQDNFALQHSSWFWIPRYELNHVSVCCVYMRANHTMLMLQLGIYLGIVASYHSTIVYIYYRY